MKVKTNKTSVHLSFHWYGRQNENKTLKAVIDRLKNEELCRALAAQAMAGKDVNIGSSVVFEGISKEIDIALGNRKPDDDPLENALKAVNDGNMQMIRDAVGFTRV